MDHLVDPQPTPAVARKRLVCLLQLAHAGERAAAHAYRGHWRSLPAGDEREAIRKIENEEWEHRRVVLAILHDLGAEPQPVREFLMGSLGSVLGALCHLSGWFAPMYGAGKLEAQNVNEYTTAGDLARAAQLTHHIPALVQMAAVEREHEIWFRLRCQSHWLARIIPLWRVPMSANGSTSITQEQEEVEEVEARKRANKSLSNCIVADNLST